MNKTQTMKRLLSFLLCVMITITAIPMGAIGENHVHAAEIDSTLEASLNEAKSYIDKDGELVLGPFQGLPACVRIPVGRGVCGGHRLFDALFGRACRYRESVLEPEQTADLVHRGAVCGDLRVAGIRRCHGSDG